MHFDAVAGSSGRQVTAVADDCGVNEVFVKMIYPLDNAVFQGSTDGNVVEHREVLDVLAEADATGVRADWDLEMCIRDRS